MSELILKGINKVDEFTDPELIPLTTATKLENLVLDNRLGKPTKRGGFGIFNANSAGAGIYTIKDLIDSSGNNQLIGVIGKTLKKSSAGTGTWSTFHTFSTGDNAKFKIASYNGRFFITNGIDAPISTDLTATATDVLLSAPVVTNVTIAHSAGGNLSANAKYHYALAYITTTGEISPPSPWVTHYFDNTSNNSTGTGYQTLTLGSLPVSTDARVTGRLLYRTQADGLFPYLLTRLDNVTTSYIDSAEDTLLDLSQGLKYGQALTKCAQIVTHKERLFMGNLTLNNAGPSMIQNKWVSNGTLFAAAANDTGELPAGTWKYRAVFIDPEGNASGYIECSVTLNGTTETGITLTNIPQSIGGGIEVQLYRSKKDVYANNTDFFLRGSNFPDSKVDILADTGLGTGTLPSATTGTTGFTSGVLFSEIGKPSEFPADNFLLVSPDDGDSIQGLVDDADGILVFKKNSIYKIFTQGDPLNWQIHQVVSQIGCDEPLSIQKIGGRIYFLNNKQLYRYPDAVNKPVNEDLKVTLASISTVHDSAYSNFYQWYILIVTINSAKRILIYNEKIDTWYNFYPAASGGLTWECVTEKVFGSDRGKLIFGNAGINILSKYDESVSTDNNGSTTPEIIPLLKTKTFTKSEPNSLIRLRILWANYKKKDNQSVYHTLSDPEGYYLPSLIGVASYANADSFTKAGNTLSNGDRVMVNTIVGTTGISTTTVYYVVGVSGDSFQLSLTLGGAAIPLSTSDGTCNITPLITVVDSTNSTIQDSYKSFKKITDAMSPARSLTIPNKLCYQIEGAGLTEFNGAKIEYREIGRGQRA